VDFFNPAGDPLGEIRHDRLSGSVVAADASQIACHTVQLPDHNGLSVDTVEPRSRRIGDRPSLQCLGYAGSTQTVGRPRGLKLHTNPAALGLHPDPARGQVLMKGVPDIDQAASTQLVYCPGRLVEM
jgi:hypothetical protein